MECPSVAAFTDTYLPTVNGVTYTVQAWRETWTGRGGRMAVAYPDVGDYDPAPDEHPVRSVPFPCYDGFRLGLPRVPAGVRDGEVEVIHAHTPFALGLAALRLGRETDAPVVASYHTPTGEYADYIAGDERVEESVRAVSRRYERWFFGLVDAVVAPSEATKRRLHETVGTGARVEVVPNGIDTERFHPVDPGTFRRRHGLPTAATDRPGPTSRPALATGGSTRGSSAFSTARSSRRSTRRSTPSCFPARSRHRAWWRWRLPPAGRRSSPQTRGRSRTRSGTA